MLSIVCWSLFYLILFLQDTIDRWYKDRPEVKAWQEEVIRTTRETGKTRTLMGEFAICMMHYYLRHFRRFSLARMFVVSFFVLRHLVLYFACAC